MIKLGYKLMTEQHGPADLVLNAKRAEQAGFDFAAISDHFFPWLEEQGHAPLAWSVLGALPRRPTLGLMTAVTCPIMRYHPAIIAQATATHGLCWPTERFTLGLGAGERLNEHVIGAGWPGLSSSATSGLSEASRHHPGTAGRQTHDLSRPAFPARSRQAVRSPQAQAGRGHRGGRWPPEAGRRPGERPRG